jgi:outer membrane receptor protein involved in Fe transport
VYADFEDFHSNFLAVPAANPPRSVGRMSLNQTVPTKGVGGMAQWSRAFGGNQVVSGGVDWHWVTGESQEGALDPTFGQTVVTTRYSGGSQQSTGAFVQDIISPMSKLEVTLSARLDHWRNYDGHNLETTVATGQPTANNRPSIPERTDTVGSPRVAALYHLTDAVGVWGDFGYGFRAPTLNELYRQFSKGAVLTKPNDQLGPERLKGGEFGVKLSPLTNLAVGATWFDNRIHNPVSNVSQNRAGTLVMRQNLGSTRIWGIQTDVDYQVARYWHVSGGYLYDQAKVVDYTTDPALGLPSIVGNFLPQVPENRGSIHIAYVNPKIATVAFGVQFIGKQFDDDQNAAFVLGPALSDAGYPVPADPSTSPGLPAFKVFDLTVTRSISRDFEAFFNAQNLLDRTYFVSTRPDTVGSPRLVSVGIRVKFQGK